MIQDLCKRLFRPPPHDLFGNVNDEHRVDVQIQPCHTVIHLPDPNGKEAPIVCAYEVAARSPFWPDEAVVKGWFTTRSEAETWASAVANAANLLIWCRLDSPLIQQEHYRWNWELLAIGWQSVPTDPTTPYITVRDIAFVGTGERSAIMMSVQQQAFHFDGSVLSHDYRVAIWLPSSTDTIHWIRWCVAPDSSLPPLEGIVAAHGFWARMTLGEVVRVTRSDGWEGLMDWRQPSSPSARSSSSYTAYLFPQGSQQEEGARAFVRWFNQGIAWLLHTPSDIATVLAQRTAPEIWRGLWGTTIDESLRAIPALEHQATFEQIVAQFEGMKWSLLAIISYRWRSDPSSSWQHERGAVPVRESISWVEMVSHIRQAVRQRMADSLDQG